ncbi:MAG TPA: hypothetical protein V6C97_15185 [Oculatellaceae cyanobacterium]
MSKQTSNSGPNLPISACIVMALLTGLVSGASFEVIKYWPLPVSVVPALDFTQGFLWGVVVGGVSGLVLGFVTDDNNYSSSES